LNETSSLSEAPATSEELGTSKATGKKEAPASQRDDLLQIVSFEVGGEEFGVDILKVQEIIRPVAITEVPNAPAFVEGVINLRGRIIPIVDLRVRFGLEARSHDAKTRIIVVELQSRVVGFVTDAVNEVMRVRRSVIEPPPELALGIDARFIRSVAKLDDRLLILLDLQVVINDGDVTTEV
jgi:purine-binding chemotaxis protein CheW